MSIAENIHKLRQAIPPGIQIVAVSKTRTADEILEAYTGGHRLFGENRVQELMEKQPGLPADINWHFVGHLQRNKVKYLASFISMIHSVDSLKLLQVIDKEAKKHDRVIPCLLQVHIAREESKFGLSEEEINGILESDEYAKLGHVRISGVMGMATFTADREQIRSEFIHLREVFLRLKEKHFSGSEYFREKSMGMSGDYLIAIEEGSTMIRVGTLIFGPRYTKINGYG